MKPIYALYSTALLALVLLLTGCEKDKMQAYTLPDMIYVYKDQFNTKKDSTTYSFAIRSNALMVDTVKIPVRIMGEAKNIAREVKFRAVADSSNAVQDQHYTFLPYTIPAGAFTADLPLVVKRTADMKTKEMRLLLEIIETKDFKPGVPNSTGGGSTAGGSIRYLVKINDFLTKPSNWDGTLVFYFGTYSAVKYKMVIDLLGRAEFPTSGTDAVGYTQFLYYKQLCKNALAAYEAANGPLFDENGIRITFPN